MDRVTVGVRKREETLEDGADYEGGMSGNKALWWRVPARAAAKDPVRVDDAGELKHNVLPDAVLPEGSLRE